MIGENASLIRGIPMSHCRKCLLPAAAPGADLDDQRVCAYCRGVSGPGGAASRRRAEFGADLERTLADLPKDCPYQVLVCLSGGKDSIYLLHTLKIKYGLRVLAFTTDMNVPDTAWDNIRRTVAKLDIDHIVHRPEHEFYKKLFRYLLRNQEERGAVRTICYVCAPLFEGDALRLATEKAIPLICAGYGPGQPDPGRMLYEFSPNYISEVDWTPQAILDSGLFTEQELTRFWNPLRYPAGTRFPRFIAPFHAWDYDQEECMRRVVELGLVASRHNASPVHSNCPVNWLLMHADLKQFGYNPYAPEFSSLIREGKASRLRWRVAQPIVNAMIRRKFLLGRQVDRSLEWLDLSADEFAIVRPAVVDPPSSRF
jgi:hypothetical protein